MLETKLPCMQNLFCIKTELGKHVHLLLHEQLEIHLEDINLSSIESKSPECSIDIESRVSFSFTKEQNFMGPKIKLERLAIHKSFDSDIEVDFVFDGSFWSCKYNSSSNHLTPKLDHIPIDTVKKKKKDAEENSIAPYTTNTKTKSSGDTKSKGRSCRSLSSKKRKNDIRAITISTDRTNTKRSTNLSMKSLRLNDSLTKLRRRKSNVNKNKAQCRCLIF